MFLQELQLQQFRCFADKKLYFSAPITLITGNNGIGKTSIVEAIYYLSYFKSFRSHLVSDLMQTGTESFFLKGQFRLQNLNEEHSIQIGYSQKRKSIKFDQKQLSSHRQVLELFQVVTLTEDDIDLIKGYPAGRRAFIDQAVLLANPQALQVYREFKQILACRNAFLERYQHNIDRTEFAIWTQKLLEISCKIQQMRQDLMSQVQAQVNELIEQFFDGIYRISLAYEPKLPILGQNSEVCLRAIEGLFYQERGLKRSLFGAHLDDLVFQINGQKARIFASRGQQKLICLLCKLSLILIPRGNSMKPMLLVDDFISDFDKIRLQNLIKFFISRQNQIIITAPFFDSGLQNLLEKADPDVQSITS
ncbi:hypothetical protein A3J41_00560 [candidate division TM6 bacterium RIFCSPHIGHO2_12_FULL_38_8]|nr:MAG: hypothetical protein A3J41_00560 [candidate division TM6 bacterium RIFCSPHIGHO2_12_FULL_38_8]